MEKNRRGFFRGRPRLGKNIQSRWVLISLVLFSLSIFGWFSQETVLAAGELSWKGNSIVYNNQIFDGPHNIDNNSTFKNFYRRLVDGGKEVEAIIPNNSSEPQKSDKATYYKLKINANNKYQVASGPTELTFAKTNEQANQGNFITNMFNNNSPSQPAQPAQPGDNNQNKPEGEENQGNFITNMFNNKDTSGRTSCAIPKIGWIVCGISEFLAEGMDFIYKTVSWFVVVNPLPKDRDSVLYRVWEVMRSTANASFAVFFLLVIFSQITNLGLSNYGIKKAIPRLIVAAIMVNLSYLICTLAIDVANVVGNGLYNLFPKILQAANAGESTIGEISWAQVTALTISGGAVAGGGILLGLSSVAGLPGFITFILPSLVALIISGITAIITLGARQAIIITLVFLAPLAFVANLLPNTERWFERWKSTFITLLTVYPLFTLLFGSSQLIGEVIINTAAGNNSLTMIILGLIVQSAPLIVLPLLVKTSSRLLGTVNDRTKGVLDRFKNATQRYADDRLAMQKAEYLANKGGQSSLPRKLARARSKYAQQRSMRREIATKNYEAEMEKYYSDKDNKKAYRLFTDNIVADENLAAAKQEAKKAERDMIAKVYQQMDKEVVVDVEGKARINLSGFSADWEKEIAKAGLRRRVAESATRYAQSAEEKSYLSLLAHQTYLPGELGRENTNLVEASTGIMSGDRSAQNKLLAQVIAAERKIHNENVANMEDLIGRYNISDSEKWDTILKPNHQLTKTIHDKYGRAESRTFDGNDKITREALIRMQVQTGNYEKITELYEQTGLGGNNYEYRELLANLVWNNKLQVSAPYLGISTPDTISQGKFNEYTINTRVIEDLAKGRVSAESIKDWDKDALDRAIAALSGDVEIYKNGQVAFRGSATEGIKIHMPEYKQNLPEIINYVELIKQNPLLSQNLKANVKTKLEELQTELIDIVPNWQEMIKKTPTDLEK